MQNWNSDASAASSKILDAPVLLRIAATKTDVSSTIRRQASYHAQYCLQYQP
jgi:ABC-type branched-subunit amino acid transport system substrate-binding protein